MTATRVKVPLLDLQAQYAPLRAEMTAAFEEVVDKLAFISGPYVAKFEGEIAEYVGASHGVGVSSGTDALLVALMALDLGPGDEVITCPFTFFATAGCIVRTGARAVFVDMDPLTFNIDPAAIEAAITPNTKAIMPVHVFGQCADMAAINAIAAKHDLPVIADAAQAIGARDSDGRAAGSLGKAGCFSFYPSKNLGAAGDGGMITTNDADFAHRMSIMRNHGMEPAYHHEIMGGNFRLDGIQGAILSLKLKHLDGWAEGRRRNAVEWGERFADRGIDQCVTLPHARDGVFHVYNQYTIRVPDGKRDALMQHLRDRDIGCVVYYPSGCHTQPVMASQGFKAGDFPLTEQACAEVLSIPVFAELSDEQKDAVVEGLASFFGL
jgi:dTDP-4-amino-4,6-dideoxygalactose transaminase